MKILLNGRVRDVRAGASLSELVRDLGLRPELVAIEVNGELVPRSSHASRELRAGDAVELVTLVGGG